MDPRLQRIVSNIRRTNPPRQDLAVTLEAQIVDAGLKQELTESDVVAAAEELGLDAGDVVEELASWL